LKDSRRRGFRRDPAAGGLRRLHFRFTTFERVQLRELTVIKRNGRRVPFEAAKAGALACDILAPSGLSIPERV